MPTRIQIRRDRPWQTTPKAIICARRKDKAGRWRNEYTKKEHGTAEQCVRLYIAAHTDDAAFRATVKRELGGKDLACWCKPGDPCHAEVLLRWANEAP
jgi:hypothetical protein